MPVTKLGRCPRCDESIPTSNKLIEYESGDGWTAMFAKCPDCKGTVHPQ